MDKIIGFKGITSVPTDSNATEGTTKLAVNLVCEGGEMVAMEKPRLLFKTESKLVYVHSGIGYTHYICYDGDVLSYYDSKDTTTSVDIDGGKFADNIKMTSVGNTLIVDYGKGVEYYLWNEGEYKELGTKPPMPQIKFGLSLTEETSSKNPMASYTLSGVNFRDLILSGGGWSVENAYKNGKDSAITAVQGMDDAFLSVVNSFLVKHTNDNKFVAPFLVRYAYKLSNGSHFMQSIPVLMQPNSEDIKMWVKDMTGADLISSGNWNKLTALVNAFVGKLKMELDWNSITDKESLKNWADIITGIDIAVTAPIYTFDQSGHVYGVRPKTDTYGIGYSLDATSSTGGIGAWAINKLTNKIDATDTGIYEVRLPKKESEAVNNAIRDASLFYVVQSIALDEITTGEQDVKMSNNTLSALTSKPIMGDDYKSHNFIKAESMVVYNSRLNLANVAELVVNDQAVPTMMPKGIENASLTERGCELCFVLRTEEGERMVKPYPATFKFGAIPRYLFFPDTRCVRAELRILGDEVYKYQIITIPMKEHKMLNGSVWFGEWMLGDTANYAKFKGLTEQDDVAPTNPPIDWISYPNKIYTSEALNPFVFNPTNINTIGLSNIKAIGTATKALSTGQFGAFPLYAFCEDGIWALSVNQSGGWSSIQPVSRDVITDNKICQLDTAIAFQTARGIYILQGSEASCIAELQKNVNKLDGYRNLDSFWEFATEPKEFEQIDAKVLAYDYARGRLLVYGENVGWCYNLESSMWTQISESYDGYINGNPTALLTRKGEVYVLDATKGNVYDKAVLLTRPSRLDSFALKAVKRQMVRRYRMNVKSGLYATNNYDDCKLLRMVGGDYISRKVGTPYRAFAALIVCDGIKDGASLSAVEYEYEEKYNDKIR